MGTEYFLFVHHTTSILAKLSTWCFEHSGDISFSLLVNPSHTDESLEGGIYIYILRVYSGSWTRDILLHVTLLLPVNQRLLSSQK